MGTQLQRQLTSYVNVAVLLSLIGSVLAIYYFIGQLNRQAVETDNQLVQTGFAALISENEGIVESLAVAPEASALSRSGDLTWLDTAGGAPEEPAPFDLALFHLSDSNESLTWSAAGDAVAITPAERDIVLADLRAAERRGARSGTHVMQRGNTPFIVSATRLAGAGGDRAGPDDNRPVLMIARELNSRRVANLGDLFGVNSVHFSEARTRAPNQVELQDAAGHSVGVLTWLASTPGYFTLRVAIFPIIGYVGLFLILAIVIGRRTASLGNEARKNESRAIDAARRDRLTGLPNRNGFNDILEGESANRAALDGQAAVVFVDLNGFKSINDRAGHAIGDEVLRLVARRLSAVVNDEGALARIGGDEFAVILTGPKATRLAMPIARRLISCLEVPLEIDEAFYEVGAAVGVALSTRAHTLSLVELVQNADVAMYRAKNEQMTRPLCYGGELEREVRARREMANAIRVGIACEEFHVAYQPIVRSRGGNIASVEALLRWSRPGQQPVGPDEFIPVAEDAKLIAPLGEFVLHTVCREIAPIVGLNVAINLSPAQLKDPDLCERFTRILKEYDMPPERMEIELTEGILVDNLARAKSRLRDFSMSGFKVNLDDFGTGFASLGYLRAFKFDKIKIDSNYGGRCDTDPNAMQTLQALALLSKTFNMEVVAEGIENADQARMVRMLELDYMQGWHFGRPMPIEDLIQLIEAGVAPIDAETAIKTAQA